MSRRGINLMTLARSLPSHVSLEFFVRIALLLIFVAIAFFYLLERKQSFTLYVHTKSATIEVTGSKPQSWFLGGATLCKRTLDEGPDISAFCDEKYYNSYESEEVEVTWQKGAVLTLRGMDAKFLSVHVSIPEGSKGTTRFDMIEITDQSVLIFERRSLERTGSLVLAGHLAVGEIAETGSVHLLQGGFYEIRESLRLSSGPTVVATGRFLPGDYITIQDKEFAPVPMQMLITAPHSTGADFDLIATSPPRKSAIVVQRIGATKTRITSRWMDRMANDALPLAISIFLGLLGASLGIAKGLIGSTTVGRRTPKGE